MIGKQDILDRAAEWRLRADVVEKDFVLGWLLAAIAAHPEASTHWVFKGGTCLKKCYFETYRFSEDLDFSLLPDAAYTDEALRQVLTEIARSASEVSGIEFPSQYVVVQPRQDKQGRLTFEGRIAYRGPLAVPSWPRVTFDLTQHEPVIDGVSCRSIHHPYPDTLPDGALVGCYSLPELFAEKTRALFERTRPRDLYDLVYILENQIGLVDLGAVRRLFANKCRTKGFEPPASSAFAAQIKGSEELRSEWENMLAHQLPELRPLNPLLQRLEELLKWIEVSAAPPAVAMAAVPLGRNEEVFAPAGLRYWGAGLPLETIRFAGANRLILEFGYKGRRRLVEPYSLRRATTGNLLLYAWEQASAHMKAFNVANMHDVRTTRTPFTPRYRVEFVAAGPLSIPASPSGSTQRPRAVRRARPPARARKSVRGGPAHVFRCPYCQKLFRRSSNNPRLRAHKGQFGDVDCPGRTGYLVRIE